MKALLLLLPLVAAKNGPVLMPEAGTAGMDSSVFDGMKNAQNMAQEVNSQKRRGVDRRSSNLDLVKGKAMYRVVEGMLTTLKPVVKRQNTRTTTVTEEKTISGGEGAAGAEVLVTATVTQTVRAKASNAAGDAEGAQAAEGAKETVTTTVTAGGNAAESAAGVAAEGAARPGAEASARPGAEASARPGAEASARPGAEASASAGAEAASSAAAEATASTGGEAASAQGAEATSSASAGSAESSSVSAENGASPTGGSNEASAISEGGIPQGTGGVTVPLSAVIPQDAEALAGSTGTDLLAGFTYRGRTRAKRRRRLVRTRDLQWLWT